MKQWFKRGLFTLVVIVIVALVGAAVFLLTFDPNAYKTKVEQIVYERYQRHLRIDGEIELSLFPRIGLAVEDVSLSDNNSDEVFASVDSARFAVAVWPLLWDRLVVDHVAVSGFKVWIDRDENDNFNFTDLLQRTETLAQNNVSFSPIATAQAQATGTSSTDTIQTEFQIDIAGLELKAGEIHFFNVKTGTQLRVVDLELNTGRMTFGQPFDVIYKGVLQGDKPIAQANLEGQAVVQLEPHKSRYSAQRINTTLTGDVGPYLANTTTLRGSLEYLPLLDEIRTRNLELVTHGQWQDDVFSLNKASLSLQAAQLTAQKNLAVINTEKLQLRVNGLLPVIEGQPEHKIELAVDVPKFSMTPAEIQGEPAALSFKQSQGESMFGVNTRIKSVTGRPEQWQLEQVQVDLAKKNAQSTWKLTTNAAVTWLQESLDLQWRDSTTQLLLENEALTPSTVQAELTGYGNWSWLNHQGYLEGILQSDSSRAQLRSTMTYKDGLQLETEVVAEELSVTPWLQFMQATLGAKKVQSSSKYKMLVDYINWINLQVALDLQAQQLHAGGYELQQVQLRAQQKDRAIQLHDLQAELFSGTVAASGSWQHDTDKIALKAKLKEVDLAAWAQAEDASALVAGLANITADINTQGRTALAWRAGLAGTVSAQIPEGYWVGYDFWQHFRSSNEVVRNAFSGQVDDPIETYEATLLTPFKQLDAQIQFNQGQGQIKKLVWEIDGLRMRVEPGSYLDLPNQQLETELRFDLIKKTLAKEQADLISYTTHPLYVRFSGPWQTPTYRLQWQRAEHPAIQEAIDNGLLELLGKPDLSVELNASTKVNSAEDATKSLGNTIKELLKK